jgi:hypothetical protein
MQLRKGFPVSMTTSIWGDLKEPEKPSQGIPVPTGSRGGDNSLYPKASRNRQLVVPEGVDDAVEVGG